jgi:hypothetical protein
MSSLVICDFVSHGLTEPLAPPSDRLVADVDHPPRPLRRPPSVAPARELAPGTRAGRTVPPRAARSPHHRILTTGPRTTTGNHQRNSRTNRQTKPIRTSPGSHKDQLLTSRSFSGVQAEGYCIH